MGFLFPSVSRSNSSDSQSSARTKPSVNHTAPQLPPLSARSSTSSFSTDFRPLPPKSPKRFWAFSTQVAVPLPPLPDMPGHARSSSANSVGLGTGAEVIRRPSEAARGMKQHAKVEPRLHAPPQHVTSPRSPSRHPHHDIDAMDRLFATSTLEPRTAPLPMPSEPYGASPPPSLPVTAPLRTKSSRTSMKSTRSRHPDESDRRATIKPPPRTALPPVPFAYTLLSSEIRPAPTAESSTIITLEFAYSTEDQCQNNPVKLTFEILKRGGGHLVHAIEAELDTRDKGRDSLESDNSGPSMTDGETSEESELDSEEYGLEALLRDEYLRSLMLPDSPSFLKDFPPPPPVPTTFSISTPTSNKPRAQTRNQYTQQDKFPSPSSPFTARSHTLPLNLPPAPPHKAPLTISTTALAPQPVVPFIAPKPKDGGGIMTELRILLLRDAAPYHIIAQRLITGSFVNTALHGEGNGAKKKKVEDEARWLGMTRLAEELGSEREGPASAGRTSVQVAPVPATGHGGPVLRHKKSGVLTGGQGYI